MSDDALRPAAPPASPLPAALPSDFTAFGDAAALYNEGDGPGGESERQLRDAFGPALGWKQGLGITLLLVGIAGLLFALIGAGLLALSGGVMKGGQLSHGG